MSGDDLAPGEDWRDLLSALLDGELAPDEEARVRDLVAASRDAQEELAGLAQVRTLVRELPPVDPPFGFYERMLRPARRHPRHIGAKVAGAVAAAAAAIVLVVGITPATDAIAPPVEAYAARHQEMDPVSSTEPQAAAAPVTTTADTAFTPTDDAELDAMGKPDTLAGDFHLLSGYRSAVGALHLVYSDGVLTVSVFEQPGEVAWDQLPAGTREQVGGMEAWTMVADTEEIMVLQRGPVVYTVVAHVTEETHDEMAAMAVELPEGADPSMLDRFGTSCRSMAARFSLGTSEP